MKVSLLDVDETRKKIEVLLPKERIEKMREETLNDIKSRVKIKGFRPGRAPKEMVALYYGDIIEEEIKKRMVEETLPQALRELSIEPIVKPIVNYIEKDETSGYVMECEVFPFIDIGDYKGIEVDSKKVEVKEEEIQERLERLRNMHAVIKEKEEKKEASYGDIAVIKYQGYLDGKPLKEARSDSYPLELGNGVFMPEFEDAIVGMKKGEEKEIEILFPEDYPDKEVAGKKVIFKVYLKELKERIMPDISDEFAKDLSFENLGVLKQEISKSIQKEKEALLREHIYRTVMDRIVDGIEIPIPERYFQSRVEDVLEDLKERMIQDNLVEEEKRKLKEEIERRVRQEIKEEIVLMNIAKREAIEVSQDDIDREIKKIAEETKRPYTDTRTFFEKSGLMGYIRNRVLLDKTREFLINNAKIKETQ
ncbi:MAG: trigger factor [Deltaproteobacteria bacterium]|nr:trigger factor [Deltaproteobacteria bacterium]